MGMTLTQMIAAVVDRTDRPDMASTITGFIQQTANKLHSQYDFAKDIVVVPISNPAGPAYVFDYDASVLDKFRKIKEIRFLDMYGNELTEIKVDKVDLLNMLDYTGQVQSPSWMALGGYKYRIRSDFPVSAMNIYYYAYPNMGSTDGTFTSWIANEYPWVFIDMAVRAVKNNTGDDSSAALLKEEIQDHMKSVVALGDIV